MVDGSCFKWNLFELMYWFSLLGLCFSFLYTLLKLCTSKIIPKREVKKTKGEMRGFAMNELS